MIFGNILNYVLGTALAFSMIIGVVHGERRYAAGMADERRVQEAELARKNETIRALSDEADIAKGERDQALTALVVDAAKTQFAKLTPEQVKLCSLPDGARKPLNAIRINRGKPS